MKNLFCLLSLLFILPACDDTPSSNFDFPKTFVRDNAEKIETKYYILNASDPTSSQEITVNINSSLLKAGQLETDALLNEVENLTFINSFNFLSETMVELSIYDGFDFVTDTTVTYENNSDTYILTDFLGADALEVNYNTNTQKIEYPFFTIWGMPVGATEYDDGTFVFGTTLEGSKTFIDYAQIGTNELGLSDGDTLAIAHSVVLYE